MHMDSSTAFLCVCPHTHVCACVCVGACGVCVVCVSVHMCVCVRACVRACACVRVYNSICVPVSHMILSLFKEHIQLLRYVYIHTVVIATPSEYLSPALSSVFLVLHSIL